MSSVCFFKIETIFVSVNLVFFIVVFDRLKLIIIHTERALSDLSNSNFNWQKSMEGYNSSASMSDFAKPVISQSYR